jgi:hypothetical protein
MMKNMNRSHLLEKFCMIVVAVVAISWHGVLPAAKAQANRNSKTLPPASAQKHAATLRASDSAEGSRVSISADASLDEYEAYRRGDRFYVKLPSTDVSQAQANLKARGFQDVTVQKNGANTVLSFHLQPGTTARVDQKGNHLDVVFTAPGGFQSPLGGPSGSNSANSVPAPTPNNVVPSPTKGQSAAGSTTTGQLPNSAGNSPASTQSPSRPLATPGSASQDTGDSWLGSGDWRSRLNHLALMARLNWIPIAIGVLVVLLLIAVALSRRAKARHRKDIVSLPRKLKKKEDPATGPSPASSVARTEQLSEITPVKAASPDASSLKLDVPAMIVPATEVAPREKVDVAGAQAEASSMLTGSKSQTPAAVDTSAREVIATELLSALAGRNPERRDRAREAFIQSGYFDDATRDLRVAEAPAERASAARKLALVRDFEATPHLIAALDDEAAEVRRSAVEALADLRDPAAIPPLNQLLRTERDRKLPQSVIRHAIESCATAEHPTPTIRDLQEFSPPNIPSAPIEPDREVIEI